MVRVNFTAERIDAFKCAIDPKTNKLEYQSFLWDISVPGFGLCVTRNGIKSFIFQTKLERKEMRVTIGAPDIWSIRAAQAEALRLKLMIDNGQDLRRVQADGLQAEQAARDAKEAEKLAIQVQVLSESITLGDVWSEYIKEHSSNWSTHYLTAHRKVIQAGGEKIMRSSKLTGAGSLASLASLLLIDLTTERIDAWAKVEASYRPSSGRLALLMLHACINWCSTHAVYGAIVTTNVAKSAKAREILGKAKVKHHLLRREQLDACLMQ